MYNNIHVLISSIGSIGDSNVNLMANSTWHLQMLLGGRGMLSYDKYVYVVAKQQLQHLALF